MLSKSTTKLGLLVLSSAGVFATGCGDGPICPSELVMVIQSPDADGTVSSADDLDPNTAGVQTGVTIRSNFDGGSDITLTVEDTRTNMVSQYNAITNEDGDASFPSVTLPAGGVILTAEGSSECGSTSDQIAVNVVTDGLCDLTIDQTPVDADFYAPIPVLNAENDSDTSAPNFQATFTVETGAGFVAELFVLDVDSGVESSVGTETADGDGNAAFSTTLGQGRQVVRATCSTAGVNAASATASFHVDTVVPTCTLTNPAEGVTVTPDDDEDGNDTNGIQMTWTGTVDDGTENDTEGEGTSFFRDTTEYVGTSVAADGTASTSDAEFTAPGSYEVSFATQDHAENSCVGAFTANVILDGCSITIDEPSAIVTTDSDANGANGLQANFTVTVDTDCAGETVFVDCGQGETSATAPANGITTVPNVTLSQNANSENTATCTARVVNSDNFQTSNDRLVEWDTLAPSGTLGFTFPAGLSCGDTILNDVANDVDGNLTNGLQINARVVSALATTRIISVTNSVCTPTACETAAPAGGASVAVDLELGSNDIRAVTGDAQGNTTSTGQCLISVQDIIVDIVGAAGSGVANTSDGTVNGDGDLEMTVCATSSLTAATAELEVTTGGTPTTASMSFNAGLGQFCTDAPFAFEEGAHQLVVTVDEIAGARTGSDTVSLTVDLTPPGPPTGFTADSPNHQEIDASWVAGAGAARYILKIDTAPIVDFDNDGSEVPGVGLLTAFTIPDLDAGTEYHLAIVSEDSAGNRSGVQTLGPIIPEYDASGAIEPPDLATANGSPRRYGMEIVRGNFNGDAFDDIAVSAALKTSGAVLGAGEVYIHFGSATGFSATPDVTIGGTVTFGTFGFAMTRLNWTATNSDGLAISAPFADRAYVFHGATISSGSATLTADDADIDIVVNTTANWFTGGRAGLSMASGQLDSAGTMEDLILGAPLGGGVGGAAIIYGGAMSDTTITLSDSADGTDMAGLEGHIFQNPVAAANGSLLGNYVAYLGDLRTGGGVGDVGVAYASDELTTGEDNQVYILRGRTPSGTAGMSFITLGATDLTVVNPTADTSNAFGNQMASIADVSGDGFRDLVITGLRDGNGQVWIVRGNDTGTRTLSTTADYLTRITGAAPGSIRFGSGVANNAIEADPDINGDGLEDLVIAGGTDGTGTFPGLFVWYGGNIPTGNTTAASAAYTIEGPAAFTNLNTSSRPNALQAAWAGDLNGDGLTDIVWSDWQAGVAAETEGRIEILTDL